MKKVLIVYAMYGSGHKSVANNIYDKLSKNKNVLVEMLDITNFANILGKASFKVFDFVIKYRTETLYNAGYELIDNKLTSLSQKKISKLFFDNSEIRDAFVKFDPDVVIATHFYGATLASYYNEKKIISSKISTILTDYASHSEWLSHHRKKDVFFVANNIVKEELIKFGVEKNKIFAYGIPLQSDKMRNLKHRKLIKNKYKVNNNMPVILFFGGSTAGSLTYYEYFKNVVIAQRNANIIFISGKNEELKNKCDAFVQKNKLTNVVVLGFTTDIYNLMNISDFVITKPGGATITECMGFNLPMILIPGLGGQERYNIKYIKKEGFGTFSRRKVNLNKHINEFLKPNVLSKYKRRLINNSKKDSSELICDYILNKLN